MNCIEGYEKNNALSGSYACEADGKWHGEKIVCIPKDCGSPPKVNNRLGTKANFVAKLHTNRQR